MGVLYEHWRTDTNECFYVGAAWANPDTRPYEMKASRNDDHLRVQEEVKSAGGTVEVRLIECSHLSDDELDELETLQIAYWKELIGDRLVNRAKGGRVGWGFAWSDEMREAHRVRMKNAGLSEKVKAWRDSQTEEEKSTQSLKIWDSRRANGTDTVRRDEFGRSIPNLKDLQTKRKNGTDKQTWWDNKSDHERSELGRLMSEGKKNARKARGEEGLGYGRKLSLAEINNLKESKRSYWANLSDEDYKLHCDNISKGRKAADERRRNELKDK